MKIFAEHHPSGTWFLVWDSKPTEEFYNLYHHPKETLVLSATNSLIPISFSDEKEEILKYIQHWKKQYLIPQEEELEKLKNSLTSILKND